jgi:hypothetical protein
LIKHQFVPQDFDEDYCDVEGCDRHIDDHANIEGITHPDEVIDFGMSDAEAAAYMQGRYGYEPEEW